MEYKTYIPLVSRLEYIFVLPETIMKALTCPSDGTLSAAASSIVGLLFFTSFHEACSNHIVVLEYPYHISYLLSELSKIQQIRTADFSIRPT